MNQPPVERRLAAILAADMVGYSRLMEADETGTLARLKTHRLELIDPAIAKNKGRLIKTAGDGMLVEFSSVADAVACAVEIQRRMAGRNSDAAPGREIRFRIGINLGDVISEDDDIFGDGVNVAARLQELAEPGGICVSGAIRDQAGDRLGVAFEDLGEQSVKNLRGRSACSGCASTSTGQLPCLRLPRPRARRHRWARSRTSRRSRCCRSPT